MNNSEQQFLVGQTEVRVMRRNIHEQTRRESIDKIHEGIIVQNAGRFMRVFNPMSPDKGGDISPVTSELFPVQSRCCWLEVIGVREPSRAWPIPAELRN